MVLKVADEVCNFSPGSGGRGGHAFREHPLGAREMTVRDPDGRIWRLQAPRRCEAAHRQPAPVPDGRGIEISHLCFLRWK